MMNSTYHHQAVAGEYELLFLSLFGNSPSMIFPCDATGHVDMDRLSEKARTNYLYARASIGRDFAFPAVLPSSSLH
jgi:hypothetical protein